MSDDGLDERSQVLVTGTFPWAIWTRGPQRGPAANRNHGARVATGDWIVFLDDDCRAEKEWLNAFSVAVEKGEATFLEGRTICPDRTHHPLEETVENPSGGNFWSCNLAVKSATFWEVGGFDEAFLEPAQEDAEFAHRALAKGVTAAFVNEAVVLHPARRLSFRQLWRRTLMVRWFSLYLLKTRPGWNERNLWLVLPAVGIERAANLARMSWKEMRQLRRGRALRTLFQVAWSILTFPFVLPYILWWEVRFRTESRISPNSSVLETMPPVLRA